MTEGEVATVVAVLFGAFPASPPTTKTVELYETMLLDLDGPTVLEAVKRMIATRTNAFLPTVGEVRMAVAELIHGAPRAAEEAWGDVVNAVRHVGSYGAPKFEDPITAHAVECMGWRNLCLSESSEASDRARFCEIYSAALHRQRADEAAGRPLALRNGVEPPRLGSPRPAALAGLLDAALGQPAPGRAKARA